MVLSLGEWSELFGLKEYLMVECYFLHRDQYLYTLVECQSALSGTHLLS